MIFNPIRFEILSWGESHDYDQNKSKNVETKDLKTLPEAIKQLENQQKNKNGEIIINKQVKHLGKEESKRFEELKTLQEELIKKLDAIEAEKQALLEIESSESEVEKSKSKQKRIKKSKKLDPVHEKEKLKRREERQKV